MNLNEHPDRNFNRFATAAGVAVLLGALIGNKEIDKKKAERMGAAKFKMRCESHPDLDEKAKEIMQFEMDKILNEGRTR
jgi:hypothetical protein